MPWVLNYECLDPWCEPVPLSIYERAGNKILDISGLTRDGPVDIQVYGAGWSSSAPSFEFLLWTNTRLALTQTPRAFRPRDGREPAIAACGEHEKDCHPTFVAKFTGLEPAATCVELDPVLREFVYPDCEELVLRSMKMGFEIERPTGVQKWLPGDSTNGGVEASGSDPQPDYAFDQTGGRNPLSVFLPPEDNGQRITTQPQVKRAELTVTSHDYGGVANLRGWIQFQENGTKYAAEIVPADEEPDHFTLPADPGPPACAGTGQFASLPIDEDCNGVADKWEDEHSTLNGQRMPAAWDEDEGYSSTSPKGDGLSVHDEYRGFHYVEDDGTTVLWTDTDPLERQDIFFWDSISANACAVAYQSPRSSTV